MASGKASVRFVQGALDGDLLAHPLSVIATSARWFTDRLAEYGIPLHPQSGMACGLRKLEEFRAGAQTDRLFKFPSVEATFSFQMDAIATDVITKALHWGYLSGFRLPKQRWQMLCKGDPLVFRSGPASTERHLTWETIIASLVATFADDVQFAEPDILCHFQGRRFSVAAKVCNSLSRVDENVRKGFEQSRERADAGLVFLDVAALYLQVEEFRLSACRSYTRDSGVVETMKAAVTRWCASKFDIDGWISSARSLSNQRVGVAFFVPLLIQIEKQPAPMLYTHMPVTWGDSAADMAFATEFVRACDSILGFHGEG